MSGQNDKRTLVVNSVNIHPKTPPDLQKHLADKEAAKADAGLKWGVLVIMIGVLILFGTYSWEPMTVFIQSLGLTTKLTQACPGAFISLLGFFIIALTRFKFSHTTK